ncbi:MAG: helix-turn-helix transcriptional regulator [Solirubrobacterales bacterium]
MTAPAQPDPYLAAAVRRLRHECEQTQEDLAHHADLTTSALARIERGKANPTWTTTRRIALALGVSLEELGRAVEEEGG